MQANKHFSLLAVLAGALLLLLSGCGSREPLVLADVTEDMACYEAVQEMVRRGVMDLTADSAFFPQEEVTRADAIVSIFRLAQGRAPSEPSGYADVDPSAWYAGEVAWGQGVGILTYDELFRPGDAVTRGELALMLYHLGGSWSLDRSDRANLRRYADADQIPAGYAKALGWAVKADLFPFVTRELLAPNAPVTREELAQALYAILTLRIGE